MRTLQRYVRKCVCTALRVCPYTKTCHTNTVFAVCARQAGIVGFITLQSKVRHPRWQCANERVRIDLQEASIHQTYAARVSKTLRNTDVNEQTHA